MSLSSGGNLNVAGIGTFNKSLDNITTESDYAIRIKTSAEDGGLYLGANSTISAIQAIDPGTTFSRNLAIQSQGGNVLIGTLTDSSQKLAVKGSASAPSLTANATAIASFTPSAVGTRLVVGGDSSTPFCVWMQNRHSDIDGLSYPIAINPSGIMAPFCFNPSTTLDNISYPTFIDVPLICRNDVSTSGFSSDMDEGIREPLDMIDATTLFIISCPVEVEVFAKPAKDILVVAVRASIALGTLA